MGVFLHRGPIGTMKGTLLYQGLQVKGEILSGDLVYWGMQKYVKEGSGNGQLSPVACWGTWRGGSFTKEFKSQGI